MQKLLLDTCAFIWVMNQSPMKDDAIANLETAAKKGQDVFVSPISCWEISMLITQGQLAFTTQNWLAKIQEQDGLAFTSLPPEIFVNASFLPSTPPEDLADRLIIATARTFDMCIMTRDRAILDYGKQGHVRYLEC